MKCSKTQADLWCATGNEFLHHLDNHCASREKKLHKAGHPAHRALARSLHTASKRFQDYMTKEMERIAFEFTES